jgi:hypothetical protein
MIETKPNLNIKELVLTEPVPEYFPYNLDHLLDDEEWEGINKDIHNALNYNQGVDDAVFLASRVAIAFPKRKEELPLRSILEILPRKDVGGTPHLNNMHPKNVKILYPQLDVKGLYQSVSGSMKFPTFESITGSTEACIKRIQTTDFINQSVLKTLIFYPEKRDELSRMPGLEYLLKGLIAMRREKNDYLGFAHDAAAYMILYGNRALELGDEDWQGLKSVFELEKARMAGRSRGQFLHHATNITILAADKISMTENGLSISIPQKVNKSDTPNPMPRRRRF